MSISDKLPPLNQNPPIQSVKPVQKPQKSMKVDPKAEIKGDRVALSDDASPGR